MSAQDEVEVAKEEKNTDDEPNQQTEANQEHSEKPSEQNGGEEPSKDEDKNTEQQDIDAKEVENDNQITNDNEESPTVDNTEQDTKENEAKQLEETEGNTGEMQETSMQTDGRETPSKPDSNSQAQPSTSGPELIAPPASQSDLPTTKQTHESFDIQGMKKTS